MSPIKNAANFPLFSPGGTLPDVSGGMLDYFQAMQFQKVTKTVNGFQVIETETPINCQGVLQPFTERQLFFKAEGQRAWSWFWLHTDTSVTLQVDDVVVWRGKPTRVMSRKDFAQYGYLEFHLVQDWSGSGPLNPQQGVGQ